MRKFFKPIRRKIDFILELSINQVAYEITTKFEAQKLIIDLNTKDQLFEGINSEGEDLASIGGRYSDFTIIVKQSEGLPFDRVTLFQSGEFYESFKVEPFKGGFNIEADSDKEDGDLVFRWGTEIVGLTDQSKEILANYYIDEIIKLIKKGIAKV